MRCDRCPEEAVIDQPYCGAHLCAGHLADSVWERSRRELHRQIPGFPGGTVAVALSGGKDSVSALHVAARYFRRRPNVRLVAVTVDEGIRGYRAATVRAAREAARTEGVEHVVVRARDRLGVTTDLAARRLTPAIPCSFCGVWRRQLLNGAALEAGADVLVMGFNLDDLAQTVLMNLARADVDRLGRMAPHRGRQAGLVPRIAPLAQVPEREVFLYARTLGLPFDHGECPHAPAAARNVFREVLWQLEEASPGTRHALLRTRERLLDRLDGAAGPVELPRCPECGAPSAAGTCRACEFRRRARNPLMPAGGSGRRWKRPRGATRATPSRDASSSSAPDSWAAGSPPSAPSPATP